MTLEDERPTDPSAAPSAFDALAERLTNIESSLLDLHVAVNKLSVSVRDSANEHGSRLRRLELFRDDVHEASATRSMNGV